MDIFFQDPSEVPLPPDEVRIRDLKAEPWQDGKRVRVYFEVDPFQRRPNAELTIYNQQEKEVASVSVIETMERKMEFTMHLREADPQGDYKIRALLFYTEREEPPEEEKEPAPGKFKLVDRAETSFEIPS